MPNVRLRPQRQEHYSEETLAHELAHQWFGDAVSLEQWQKDGSTRICGAMMTAALVYTTQGLNSYDERVKETDEEQVRRMSRLAITEGMTR